jgi:hypothetical protein
LSRSHLLPVAAFGLALILLSIPLPGQATDSRPAAPSLLVDALESGAMGESVGADTATTSREPQVAADPLLPRGALEFGMRGSNLVVRGLHGDGGRLPLASPFLVPELGVGQLPELAVSQARYADLVGDPSNWTLSLGQVRGRFHVDEQRVPLSIGYGLLDRVSLGVTVPLVRRRIQSSLRLSGEGATVGVNPATLDPGAVDAFLAAAEAALAELEAELQAACGPNHAGGGAARSDGTTGNGSCAEGHDLLRQGRSFLNGVEAAYQEELVFPLRGTEGGAALAQRWANVESELAGWGVEAPDALPLAPAPMDDETFFGNYIEPAWGDESFPRAFPEEYMELGDVEAHAVIGLLQGTEVGGQFRIRSSAVLSARFPTGTPDSLQLLAPLAPPQGVGGYGVRLVTDVLARDRLALLTVMEGWRFEEGETTLLAPDPSRLYGPLAVPSLPARWQPGSSMRLSVTPRFHVTPGLSLGLGYHLEQRGGDAFRAVEGAEWDRPLPAPGSATIHRLRGEFRYHGMDGVLADALPFPLEILVSYDGTLGGDGDLVPAERRMEAGIRVRRGGR